MSQPIIDDDNLMDSPQPRAETTVIVDGSLLVTVQANRADRQNLVPPLPFVVAASASSDVRPDVGSFSVPLADAPSIGQDYCIRPPSVNSDARGLPYGQVTPQYRQDVENAFLRLQAEIVICDVEHWPLFNSKSVIFARRQVDMRKRPGGYLVQRLLLVRIDFMNFTVRVIHCWSVLRTCKFSRHVKSGLMRHLKSSSPSAPNLNLPQNNIFRTILCRTNINFHSCIRLKLGCIMLRFGKPPNVPFTKRIRNNFNFH